MKGKGVQAFTGIKVVKFQKWPSPCQAADPGAANSGLQLCWPMLVSWGCCNALSQTWHLKTADINSYFWRPEVQNQGVSRAPLPRKELERENPFLPFPASGGSSIPWLVATWLQSRPLWPRGLLCVWVPSSIMRTVIIGFPGGSVAKNLPAMQETRVQSLDQEDSPGKGNGNPLQYSCLESPMERRAWRATVMGSQNRRTHLSN